MSKISVIIPLYNRAGLIRETLNSLKPEYHPGTDLEVIVVDDQSTDGGAQMVSKEYPWVSLHIQEKNSGAPSARNKGLSVCSGEYVLFLDSDDLVEPDFFTEKAARLDVRKDIVAVYGPWEFFQINERLEKQLIPRHSVYPVDPIPDYSNHLTRLLKGWFIIPHALLWKKDHLLSLKGFDVTLPINQDVDLLFRTLAGRQNILGVPSPKALYRDHENEHRVGKISGDAKKLRAILALRKKFAAELNQAGLLNEENRNSIALYCFNQWSRYRKIQPNVAEEFYDLSFELNPRIRIPGGTLLRLAGRLLGARKTTLLKQFFS